MVVTAAMMAGFHLVVDLPLGPVATRLSAADLVLPLALGLLAWCWWRDGRPALGWHGRFVGPGLVAMTVSLTLALAVGWHALGRPSGWALTNKYLGWFVLLGFFLAGALVTGHLPARYRDTVLRVLFLAGGAACVWSIGVYEALALGFVSRVPDAAPQPWQEVLGLVWGDVRMTGWLVNANSFAFMSGLLLVLLLPMAKRGMLFSPRGHTALLTLYCVSLLNNGSRAAAAGLLLALLALAVAREIPWRMALTALLAAAVLSPMLNVVPSLVSLSQTRLQAVFMLPNSGNSWSLAVRLEGYYRGWDLWLQHPLLGAGLGSFLAAEIARGAVPALVIHSTWLWLLTEAGPLGLFSAGFFFLAALLTLRSRNDGLAAGMFAVLILFGVMAMAHELMYQRHLWFLLGLVLARGRAVMEQR